eukprot:TRINITY_DN814_c0_g1_i1.p1 TRINITY_DN814_c0_g1~~TRINITY_DN814_c0_g1_i1.p1  ORF type:complete len:596 (-),score=125.98 TRINITY_DN814_c0_g1_i1:122-1909(-)
MSASSRDHMKVFKFLQIRRYPYLPANFFNRLRDWFITNSFEIAMFNQNAMGLYTNRGGMGDGAMRGRRIGLHLNFVPKFTFEVKADPSGYILEFCYYARIRKIGIASAIITQGLTAVVGAATLAGHVATERSFVESVWRAVDSLAQGPYEIILLEGPEAIDNYRPATMSTTIITQPPAVIPVAPPPQLSRSSAFSSTQVRSMTSSVQSSPGGAPYNTMPSYPPLSSGAPPPAIANVGYPGQFGSANRTDISSARLMYSDGVNTNASGYNASNQSYNASNASGYGGSTVGKSQSLYGSSAQSGTSGYNAQSGTSGYNASNTGGSQQSLYGSNAQQRGTSGYNARSGTSGYNASNTSGYGGVNASSAQKSLTSGGMNTTGSLYGSNTQQSGTSGYNAQSGTSGYNASNTSGFSGSNTGSSQQSLYGSNAQQSGTSGYNASNTSGYGATSQTSGSTPLRNPLPTSQPYAPQGFTQSQGPQSQTGTLYPTTLESTRLAGSSSATAQQASGVQQQGNPFASQPQNPFYPQSGQQQQSGLAQQQSGLGQQQQGMPQQPYASTQGYNSQGIALNKDAPQNKQLPTVSMAKGGLGYSYTYQNL